jgi:hypothetical protein
MELNLNCVQKCGCIYQKWYDDSIEFFGYETDREEEKYTFCDVHKEELLQLEKESSHILKNIVMLHEQNYTKRKSVKYIYKHAKNATEDTVK